MKIIIPLTITALSVALAGGAFAGGNVTVINKLQYDLCIMKAMSGGQEQCPNIKSSIMKPPTICNDSVINKGNQSTFALDYLQTRCVFPMNAGGFKGGIALDKQSDLFHYQGSFNQDNNQHPPTIGFSVSMSGAGVVEGGGTGCDKAWTADNGAGCGATSPNGDITVTFSP